MGPNFAAMFEFINPARNVSYTLSLHGALPISRKRMLRTQIGILVVALGLSLTGCGNSKPASDANDIDMGDRKSTRLNSSHRCISYAVFRLKKKKKRPRVCRLSPSLLCHGHYLL